MPDSHRGPLPKSDRNAELQELSITALRSRLAPSRIALRDERIYDTGVDGSLEVLVNQMHTNFRSQIQLKATDKPKYISGEVATLSVETANLNYLLNGGPSAIYVLYIAPEDRLLYTWAANEVQRISKTNPNWLDQTTTTLHFATELTPDTLDDIARKIQSNGQKYRDEINKQLENIRPEPLTERNLQYSVLQLRDISTNRIRRTSAYILVHGTATRDQLLEVLNRATNEVKDRQYFSSPYSRKLWHGTTAHCVLLFAAHTAQDIQNANWRCRSIWIDPNGPEDARVLAMKFDEKCDELCISWNPGYDAIHEFIRSRAATSEEIIDMTRPVMTRLIELGTSIYRSFDELSDGTISDAQFIRRIEDTDPEIDSLYFKTTDFPLAPPDLHQYVEATDLLAAVVHNMVLYIRNRSDSHSWYHMLASDCNEFTRLVNRYNVEDEKLRYC